MSTDVEKLVREVRSLPPEDQRRLRRLLDDQPTALPPTQATEEEFKRRLVEAGLLKEIKPRITDLEPYRHRKPFKEGKPLSETIIEERL